MKRLIVFVFLLYVSYARGQMLQSKLDSFNSILPGEKIYLQTDKPFYKPGEDVWYSLFVVDAQSHTPAAKSRLVTIQLLDPRGNVHSTSETSITRGTAKGVFKLPPETGGNYKIMAYTNWMANFGEEGFFRKDIPVQQVIFPELLLKLDFDRKSYGAGDRALALLSAGDLQNRPLSGYTGTYRLLLENNEISKGSYTTDKQGKVSIAFTLPEILNSDDVLLVISVDHKGNAETISRPVPVQLKDVQLVFFPEGGTMLQGHTNRVAFRCIDQFGKPADIDGRILDENNSLVTAFSSYKFGMGSVDFLPEAGHSYHAVIDRPRGIKMVTQLPAATTDAYLMHCSLNGKESLNIRVANPKAGKVKLMGHIRGTLYFEKEIMIGNEAAEIKLDIKHLPPGILQLTLFDKELRPSAERLVFVNRHKQLDIEIKTNKEQYLPREQVKLEVKVKDENGNPVEGSFALSVVNDKVISFADDKQDNILSYMLLSSELKGRIEEPGFYFKEDEPKAETALDLVMLTHGWRRFTWKELLAGNETAWKNSIQYPSEGMGIKGSLSPYSHANALRRKNEYRDIVLKIVGTHYTTTIDSLGRFRFDLLDIKPPFTVKVKKGVYSETFPVNNLTLVPPGKKYVPGASKDFDSKKVSLPEKLGERKAVETNKTNGVQHMANGMVHMIEPQGVASQFSHSVPMRSMSSLRTIQVIPNWPMDAMVAGVYSPSYTSYMFYPGYHYQSDFGPYQNIFNLTIDPQNTVYNSREFYAPAYPHKQTPGMRSDLRQTVYWNPSVKTGANGNAELSFYNCDEVSAFRCIVEGISIPGLAGRAEETYHTRLPFSVEAKMPATLMQGDRVSVTVIFRNNTTDTISITPAAFAGKGIKICESNFGLKIKIAPESYKVRQLCVLAEQAVNFTSLSVYAEGNGMRDEIKKELSVSPSGFERVAVLSGNEATKAMGFEILNADMTTLKAEFTAYTDLFEQLRSAMQGMIAEPHGCFEQVSSTNYPNLIAMQFLKQNGVLDAELSMRAHEALKSGYRQLAKYETPDGGFSLWGQAPGNTGLTAMGLLQFYKMRELGIEIDEKMFDRTVKWLLDKRNEKGGFGPGDFHEDNLRNETVNTYITWALSSIGYRDLEQEITRAKESADKVTDVYRMSLLADALFNLGRQSEGNKLLAKLAAHINKQPLNRIQSQTTITSSGGISMNIESLSLYAVAVMKSAAQPAENKLPEVMEHILSLRSPSGRFGSTQATVQAMQAITLYSASLGTRKETGGAIILVNGALVKSIDFTKGQGSVKISIPSHWFRNGKNHVAVKFREGKLVPYTLAVSWRMDVPEKITDPAVIVTQKLSTDSIKAGEVVRLNAEVINSSGTAIPQTVAIIGIPAGLSLQHWQLKKMHEEKMFDFYELKDNYLILYFTGMEGNKNVSLALDLKAEVSGSYRAPASFAYLYYTDEQKFWARGNSIHIAD
jgi:hypothetical protein